MSEVNDAIIHIGPRLAVALVLLTALAAVVNHLSGSGMATATVRAVLRAILQLGVLALVVTVVIDVLWASILFVLVMAAVAACTSAGRVTGEPGVLRPETMHAAVLCMIPVGAPTLVIVALLVATGVLPMTGLAIIPTAGIMFGAAMNTTSLAGKHCLDSLAERHGEVEAAMSLGFLIREARLEICRPAAATALIPALDQTRSVGLVTIPGSFVGMVLGGASPTAAAAMQLFVLIALLAVSAIASALTAEFVARGLLARAVVAA
ncbi:MAG: ABC transporter permease [Gordonia amarae]